ncbi:class I SAM-dependent methyltransferase [Modestobacter lacusdianchii]
MAGCCDPRGCDQVFDTRFARRAAQRYRRRGLDRTAQAMVELLTERGVDGATVLEIGGGVGEIQLELLARGAASATNLELSPSYEAEATALVAEAGLTGRVHRRLVDVAADPDAVEPADVVVLHRVVCCYPDVEALLGAAADHARQQLVFSHPPRTLLSRAAAGAENFAARVSGRDYRAFVHPPAQMLAVLAARGLELTGSHRGPIWRVAALQRLDRPPS